MTSPGSTPHSRISDFASGFITSVESAGKVVRTQRDVQRRELEVRLEGLKRRLGVRKEKKRKEKFYVRQVFIAVFVDYV